VHLHVEGNTFHGVPDARHIQNFMDGAVRQLRNVKQELGLQPHGPVGEMPIAAR
jgi:hypothetical protein